MLFCTEDGVNHYLQGPPYITAKSPSVTQRGLKLHQHLLKGYFASFPFLSRPHPFIFYSPDHPVLSDSLGIALRTVWK
jgi:hypothetical protein